MPCASCMRVGTRLSSCKPIARRCSRVLLTGLAALAGVHRFFSGMVAHTWHRMLGVTEAVPHLHRIATNVGTLAKSQKKKLDRKEQLLCHACPEVGQQPASVPQQQD